MMSEQLMYMWEVKYNDGAVLKQFEGDKENHYGDIDQNQLYKVKLVRDDFWVELNFHTLEFNVCGIKWKPMFEEHIKLKGDSRKLILKRRVQREFTAGLQQIRISRLYLIGWSCKQEDGVDRAAYLGIDEQGQFYFSGSNANTL